MITDRAIAGAKEHGYLQEEALGYELAAKFYLGLGKDRIAAHLLPRSLLCLQPLGRSHKNSTARKANTPNSSAVLPADRARQAQSGSTQQIPARVSQVKPWI